MGVRAVAEAVNGPEAHDNQAKIRYLKRYTTLVREVDRMLAERDKCRARIGKITAVLSDIPGGGGSIYKNLDTELIEQIVELEADIGHKLAAALENRANIVRIIESIDDDRERLLMNYRYIDGYKFEWIANEMNYTWRRIHQIHSQALGKIEID